MFPLPSHAPPTTSFLPRGPDRVGALPEKSPHIVVAWIRLLIDRSLGLRSSWSLEVSRFGRAGEESQFRPAPSTSWRFDSLARSALLARLGDQISSLVHRDLSVVAGA